MLTIRCCVCNGLYGVFQGTAAHIKQKSGMDVTYGQVIDDPGTWWPRGLRSDRDLLQV